MSFSAETSTTGTVPPTAVVAQPASSSICLRAGERGKGESSSENMATRGAASKRTGPAVCLCRLYRTC
jgi:hypothetical protein